MSEFDRVRRYVAFVGQSRSGHSVVGTLLNAHRSAVVSHNLDALALVADGVGRDALFEAILEHDRWLAGRERRIGGYSYDVPGLALGDHDAIEVIGDKRAGATSRHLARDPALLERVAALVDVPITLIHHVRDPRDNISSIYTRRTLGVDRTLAEAADHYFEMLAGAVDGIAAAGPHIETIRTYHEDLVADPADVMRPVLDALGLEAGDEFLERAAAFVHDAPRRTRADAPWNADLEADVARRAAAFPFLARYS